MSDKEALFRPTKVKPHTYKDGEDTKMGLDFWFKDNYRAWWTDEHKLATPYRPTVGWWKL